MILGYRLKRLRKDNNMSQEELGKLLGVTKVSVSGYENGTRIPSMEVLITILNVFKISADYLLGRELDVVCESNEETILMSKNDIGIINELNISSIEYKGDMNYFSKKKNIYYFIINYYYYS